MVPNIEIKFLNKVSNSNSNLGKSGKFDLKIDCLGFLKFLKNGRIVFLIFCNFLFILLLSGTLNYKFVVKKVLLIK